jgi:hypothetical protein
MKTVIELLPLITGTLTVNNQPDTEAVSAGILFLFFVLFFSGPLQTAMKGEGWFVSLVDKHTIALKNSRESAWQSVSMRLLTMSAKGILTFAMKLVGN